MYVLLFFLSLFSFLEATPSRIFWTYCTTECQAPNTWKLAYAQYFFPNLHTPHAFSPIDVQGEYGVALGEHLAGCEHLFGEVGVDCFFGGKTPLYLNGKIGTKENELFPDAPSFSLGFFNLSPTTGGIADFVVGHSLPDCFVGGNLYVGTFFGSKAIGKNQRGVMIGYTRSFYPVVEEGSLVSYDKWAFSADYATGVSSIGGGGAALSYYFTPNIYVQTGPVWVHSKRFTDALKWGLLFSVTL